MAVDVMADLMDMVDANKGARALELIEELAILKVETLTASPEDKLLYVEQLEDKLGSLEHVLDGERIVASAELAAIFKRAAGTALSAFGAVGKELVKASVAGALGGVAGGLLGGLGDTLVDKAIDAATDALSPE